VSDKFKPGDLVSLNDYGVFLGIDCYQNSIGVVLSKSYNIIPQMEEQMNSFYIVYDILLDGELIKMVPEEFMRFYNEEL
tara:strand:+ start:1951 stop:2187 length:237 start_codon:yes stop_codon:yes gene_type:complete